MCASSSVVKRCRTGLPSECKVGGDPCCDRNRVAAFPQPSGAWSDYEFHFMYVKGFLRKPETKVTVSPMPTVSLVTY